MKPIVHTPHAVLTTPAKPVKQFDKKLLSLIKDMKETLIQTKNPKGVGLAATQVGVSSQIFLIRPTEKSPIRVFINPEIIEQSPIEEKHKKDETLEGCLSIPHIWGSVRRSESLTLRYQDEHGEYHEESFSGFPATIIQHESDHLQGTLFPRRVLEQKGKLYQMSKDTEGKEALEEIEIR